MRSLNYVIDYVEYRAREVSGGFEIEHVLTDERIGKVERRTARGKSPRWHIVNGPDSRGFTTLLRAVEHLHGISQKAEAQ